MRRSSADRQLRLRLARHRSQQRMGKLPPDRRADLRHLLGRAEPVEPRHQRGVQACGDRQRRGGNRRDGPPRFALALRLQHRLGHLLHEQRNAVGALDDVLPDVRREQLVAGDAVDHGVDFALRQPIDGERGHVRPSDPGRLEFRPERHDQQHAKARDPVHHPAERFQAGGVGPMRILEDHQHRILARQRLHLRNQRLQRSLPALRRGQIERGIASVVRQRQHLGEKRGVLDRGRGLREHRVELVELRLRRVVARQSGGAFHLADDRIKRAVGVLRRAEIAQSRVRLAGEALQQRRRQPRFADASLAGEQHHLALAALRLGPAPQQQFEFFFPPDQSGQAARVQRLEAAFLRNSPAAPPTRAPVRRCP